MECGVRFNLHLAASLFFVETMHSDLLVFQIRIYAFADNSRSGEEDSGKARSYDLSDARGLLVGLER